MAKTAGHTDTVRSDQVFVVIIAWIGVVTNRIPCFLRFLIEIRVREQTYTYNTCGITVVRTDRDIFTACADFDARIFCFIFRALAFELTGRGAITMVRPNSGDTSHT